MTTILLMLAVLIAVFEFNAIAFHRGQQSIIDNSFFVKEFMLADRYGYRTCLNLAALAVGAFYGTTALALGFTAVEAVATLTVAGFSFRAASALVLKAESQQREWQFAVLRKSYA